MVLDAQNLSIPLLTAVLDFITNEASALDAVASETPAVSSFDPTKPLVLKTINLPGKTTLLESQLQALQDRRNAFESDVPERCVTVFRAENGVNPRNFGENTYANMTRASDDVESVEKEVVEKESVKKEVVEKESVKKENIMEEENDAALLKEIMARKQKEMEKKQEFRTKAKRELDQLQKQRMYKRTTLRVYLPDKTVIQAYFAPRETVGAVMEVVRGALIEAYQQLPFYLFCAPPKEMCDW